MCRQIDGSLQRLRPSILNRRAHSSPVLVVPLSIFLVESAKKVIGSAQHHTFGIRSVVLIAKAKSDILVAAKSVHLVAAEDGGRCYQPFSQFIIHVPAVTMSHLVFRVRVKHWRVLRPQRPIFDSHGEQVKRTITLFVLDLDETARMLIETAMSLTKYVLGVSIQNQPCDGDVSEVE